MRRAVGRRVLVATIASGLLAGAEGPSWADDDEVFIGVDPVPSPSASPAPPPTPLPPHDAVPRGPNEYVFEAAVRAGFTSAPIRGGNPFGAGFGARLGFDIRDFYLGATVMDYLGGSDVGATDQALMLGAEVGYSLHFGRHLTLRPQFGIGDTILSHTEPIAGQVDVVTTASGSSSSGASTVTTEVKCVYVEPALTLLLASGHFFAGIRGGALVLPGIIYGPLPAQTTTWVSYTLDAQLGFRL